MNLDGLESRTSVAFEPELEADRLSLNEQEVEGEALQRVSRFLDRVREMAGTQSFARVRSRNNFPTGTGIASSSSAFAALALAASRAAGLSLDGAELSRLARRGSGSASRSIPGGFVEWLAGQQDEDSYAVSIAPAEHWGLCDSIAVVSEEHKQTGSSEGHQLAQSSPLQAARVADTPRRLEICQQAIRQRDFAALAEVVELDCNLMHGVMMTSSPRLLYWQPATLAVMAAVQSWRADEGLEVCYTIDAGPNVHVICPAEIGAETAARLAEIEGVREVIRATPGGAARIDTESLQDS